MLVLVDMDGTIADLQGRFLEKYNARYPDEPRITGIANWGIAEDLPPGRGQLLYEIIGEGGFFAGLDPLPGALEALNAMRRAGHDVVLCTSPFIASRWCESEKRHWVAQHVGERYVRDMVVTHDKTLVRGDILIDDKPEITGRMQPAWRQVLVDQAYNRHVHLPRIRTDWSDWERVLGAA